MTNADIRKLVGPHLAGQWANKLDILRQWQPPLAVVLSPDVDKVKQLRAACPNTAIVGRFYHEDSWYASNIQSRPEDFAREIHSEIVSNPATPLLDYVQSNNEVCQSWDSIGQLNKFTLEWMRLANESKAYRCAILAFSVGNPDMPQKPNDPAGFDGRMLYWQRVLGSLNYAQHNGHILALHSYGYPDMFHPDPNWYIYRYEKQVQDNLRTLGITDLKYAYTEIGIDRLLVADKGGYKAVPTTDQDYVNQLLQWERDQQGQGLLLGGAIYTFGDSGGWGSYDITSTGAASMLAQHYADHAADYKKGTKMGDKIDAKNTVHIPFAGTGTPTETAPALPPREIDPRITEHGTRILDARHLPPGKEYWRVVKLIWYDEQEADRIGPDRHLLVDVLDKEGRRAIGVPLMVTWGSGQNPIRTEAKPGESYSANQPLTPGDFSVRVDDERPSEIVEGISMGADTPSGFNPGIHTSTGVVFQLVTMPQAEQPAPPTDTGTPAPPPAPPTGDNWRRSIDFVLSMEGGLSSDPNDPGNYVDGRFVGTKFGISAAAHPELDIVNLTVEQAKEIYKRDYWVPSGAASMEWPLSLAVFDLAVNGGVGRAQEALTAAGHDFTKFMAWRLKWYTRLAQFDLYGSAWVRRCAALMLEASKP